MTPEKTGKYFIKYQNNLYCINLKITKRLIVLKWNSSSSREYSKTILVATCTPFALYL